MINGRVKGIVAVALTVGDDAGRQARQIDLDPFAYGGLLLKEVVVGLAFAYALGAMFAALQAGGHPAGHVDRLLLRRDRRPGRPARSPP